MVLQYKQYIYFILAISLVLLIGLACKSQKIPGNWTESEIRIDGKIDDWLDVPVMYFEEEGAAISFCNDSTWLNIQFRTKDPKWIRTIKMTGITLYFDTEGKQNKNFFIKYKGGPSMKDLMDRKHDGYMTNMPPQTGDDAAPQLTCYIKDRIIEKQVHPDGSEGPTVVYDTSYGFYCYEFRIPLQESSVRYYGLDIKPGNPISIGVVWGDMGEMNGMRPDMIDMGSGMGGGRGGGRMGGGKGGGGGRGGKRLDMPSKQEVWISTHVVSSVSKSDTE